MLDKVLLADKNRWVDITLKVSPEVVIELDRLATQWDYYRYEVISELLVFALERIEAEDYQPALFPP